MTLQIGGMNVSDVLVNGQQVDEVKVNGTSVWVRATHIVGVKTDNIFTGFSPTLTGSTFTPPGFEAFTVLAYEFVDFGTSQYPSGSFRVRLVQGAPLEPNTLRIQMGGKTYDSFPRTTNDYYFTPTFAAGVPIAQEQRAIMTAAVNGNLGITIQSV